MEVLFYFTHLLIFVSFVYLFFDIPKSLIKYFFPSLLFKVSCGIIIGLIYKYYYSGGDTYVIFSESVELTKLCFKDPKSYLTFFLTSSPDFVFETTLTYHQPRIVFFAKLLSVINLFTSNNYWITGAYLSLFSFAGIWFLLLRLIKLDSSYKLPFIVAFLIYPSFVFWTSGIIKETIAIGCISFSLGLVINWFERGERTAIKIKSILFFIVLLLTLQKIKYYFFASFSVAFIPYFFLLMFQNLKIRKSFYKYSLILVAFIGVGFMVTFSHWNLSLSRVLEIIVLNNQKIVQSTGSTTNLIQFYELEPSLISIVKNFPIIFIEGIFRPFVWEKGNLLKQVAGFEGLVLAIAFVLSLYCLVKKNTLKIKKPGILWAMMVYFFINVMLITVACPNLGTLSRYRSCYLPFLVFLILIPIFNKGKQEEITKQ